MYGIKSERERRRLLANVSLFELEKRVGSDSGSRRLEETAVGGVLSLFPSSSSSEAGRAS